MLKCVLKVRYTVHSKTDIPNLKSELSVVREHEEFIWLHNCLENNDDFAGFIVRFYYYYFMDIFIVLFLDSSATTTS